MKKLIPLSIIAIVSLHAVQIELSPLNVESTIIAEVAQNAQTSADLAEALNARVPSIDMSRRSGIANDILIRGQKRDNISIEVDGTKTHGACPNRMDPPTSHVLASQIESIEVTEGPYDVTSFGVMSGGVKIKTKKPTKKFQAEINAGYGSFNYKKLGVTASGGDEFIRLLVSASKESSEQYKDGNGNTFSEQIEKSTAPLGTQYQDAYKDMDAYEKKSVMAKAFITFTPDQEVRIGVTANRSDNILYPNSKMDALYDDSNIFSIEYNVNNLTDSYKNINLQYYYSSVKHPMATNYRKSSAGVNPQIKNTLTTKTQGIKLQNTFDVSNSKLLVGLDGSKREWDGHYEKNNLPFVVGGRKSIDDAQTKNMAIFAKLNKYIGGHEVALSARYDSTHISTADTSRQNKHYVGFNINLVTTHHFSESSKVYLGIGQASRVPDARELYFRSAMNNVVGTDSLKQTQNREIDLGFETSGDTYTAKIKTFYSQLSDYIYIKKGVMNSAFENIDASVYGLELSGEYYLSDDITVEASLSYKKGKKDEALAGQTNTNLADMAPLRGNILATYEYANNSSISAEIQASDTWDTIDDANGEQEIGSWAVVNLKAKHAINKQMSITLGVNNLFDKAYATSNTYTDLTLLTSGGISDVMLLNNPGRYLYTNLSYKF